MGTLLALALAAASSGVTFEQAFADAGALPQVVAAKEAAGVLAHAKESLPGVIANPELNAQPGWRFLQEENRGLDFQVGVGQALSLGGLGDRRREVLDRDHALRLARVEAALLEARLEAARAWLQVWALESALETMDEELELAREERSRVEAGAKAQAFTSTEVAHARAFAARVQLERLEVEGELFDARVALAIATGRAPSPPVTANGAPPAWEVPSEETTQLLAQAVLHLPEVRLFALEAALEGARARAAAAANTTMRVGAILMREAPADYTVHGVMDVTLPFFDVTLHEQAPARASGRALEGEAAIAGTRAAGRMFRALHELQHAREVLEVIEGQLLPAERERVRLVGIQFERGDVSLPERLAAIRLFAQARRRRAQAVADEALARVQLRLLADAIAGEAP